MKTAISIPDRLFREADRLAKRLKKSRSRLYSEAVLDYVKRHADDEITRQLERVLKTVRETRQEKEWRRRVAAQTLKRIEWEP